MIGSHSAKQKGLSSNLGNIIEETDTHKKSFYKHIRSTWSQELRKLQMGYTALNALYMLSELIISSTLSGKCNY